MNKYLRRLIMWAYAEQYEEYCFDLRCEFFKKYELANEELAACRKALGELGYKVVYIPFDRWGSENQPILYEKTGWQLEPLT